jgi:hypothetical protein
VTEWAPSYDIGTPRSMTDREAAIVFESLQEFSQLQLYRDTFGAHWEEVAELILPTHRNTFYYGNYRWPGMKLTDRQIDSTGALALNRFAAICDSLLTPRNMMWEQVVADDPYVMKDRDTRLYFEEVTRLLFKARYAPTANFASQNIANWQSLGAFGNHAMFIDALDPFYGIGLRYKAIPLGELYWRENHQGIVDGFCRWFRLTARQVWQFLKQRNQLALFPEQLRTALNANSETPFNILHRVVPNEEWDPARLDAKGKRYASYYICLNTKTIMDEGGYNTFPLAPGRYEQGPGEQYGRSVAMMVLPALKTLNSQKKVFLQQGHRAAAPVLLTVDDGVTDFNMRPGALNKGGVSADGKLLVQALPAGNIQINKEMMEEERNLINDAFLITLFQILTESPQMTATEVIERTNEKGILLAPTMGRQASEYLGPMTVRELDVLAQLRLLPPMPARLKEARGSYGLVYTSPLARAMRAQEAAGFMRTVETVKELVNITQDMSLLDRFDFDVAVPAIAEIQSVPESWMADDKKVADKRKQRAQTQQQQAQIQAMPAQAAMMKAQAAVAKTQAETPQPQEQGVQPASPLTQGG